MMNCNDVYEFFNNRIMLTNYKMYDTTDDLQFVYFYDTDDKSRHTSIKIMVYFEIINDEMIIRQSTVIWKDDYVTYKSPDGTPEEFYFYNYPSTEELTFDSSYTKDKLFNITVQYGITESDLDLIRKWHSDFTELFNSISHKLKL